MPKTYPKRKKTKRRYRRKRSSIVRYRKSPVPMRFPTKMRYNDQITLNSGSGTADSVVIHGNSLYDPITAVGGHQPRGFDQLMALYDHFVVIGSKITVSFQATSTSANVYVGIAIRDSTTKTTDFNDYMEGGSVVSKPLALIGATPTVLSIATSPRKFLGRSKVMSDPELKGSAAANPAEGYYYHIFCASSNASSDPAAVDVVLNVDYSAVFIEPKVPAQS